MERIILLFCVAEFVRMACFLPHLHSAYAVDCAIQDETEKLVVIRFGHDNDRQCMLVGVCAVCPDRV